MRGIDEDLWVAEQPLRFLLLELGTRMTVIKLAGSDLLLHSPISPTDELCEEIDAVGSVRYLLAPNRFHHLFASDWAARYPRSELYVAPGLPEKRPDLAVAGVLPDDAPDSWRAELDCVFFEGLPLANEVVVLHKKTRTLLLCDLAFNVGPEAPWLTRLAFRLWGRYDDFGPTLFERFMVRDREAARRSLERILGLDFDRIVVTHGAILERGGRDAMRRGFDWLLSTSPASGTATS